MSEKMPLLEASSTENPVKGLCAVCQLIDADSVCKKVEHG